MADTFVNARTASPETTESHFRILDFPTELISNVCVHLEDDDLMNVRRACRALKAHSTWAFGKRFFQHLVAILHPTSLAILLEIVRHEVLSVFVREVTISGEIYGFTIAPKKIHSRPHLAIQASIKNSGLDILILLEAFKTLRNLASVRIDVDSFWRSCGIKCGRVYLYEGNARDIKPVYHPEVLYNRVYEVVFQALHSASVAEGVSLSVKICTGSYGDDSISFFNVQTPAWEKSFAMRLRDVEAHGTMDTVWLHRLICSATDIHSLSLHSEHNMFSFARTTGAVLQWPGLRRLHLHEIILKHKDFLPFLRGHSLYLEELHVDSVGFLDGNWVEPLEAIEGMPKLVHLSLMDLLERTHYENSSSSSYMFDMEGLGGALSFRNDPRGITSALACLRGDLQTEPMYCYPSPGSIYTDDLEAYVNLRKAEALSQGWLSWIDGEWVMASAPSSPPISSIEDVLSDVLEDVEDETETTST
ncbi:hypothetical protein N0V83_002044 [Neocucurbitaria cava]|uniref:F-box domain-containing protein n=1 Tax=Neocucurbitaria cava TaxID=798079 RepID=A0A9W8YDD3_9PLEO|nr:hypothetical protein N0V83_002044 [Neocucurbitaria cava]